MVVGGVDELVLRSHASMNKQKKKKKKKGHQSARSDGVFSSPDYPPDYKRKRNIENNAESKRRKHITQIPNPQS